MVDIIPIQLLHGQSSPACPLRQGSRKRPPRRECRNTCTLDLRGLAAGVYMVRVGTATGTATKRLVVQ